MSDLTLLTGDCRELLRTLPDQSVHCCVTSPPYWGLRDYGCNGQIGLEQTPDSYVQNMRAVFAEVWRVLRDDGTLWLNLGDSYNGGGRGGRDKNPKYKQSTNLGSTTMPECNVDQSLKPKDLIGIPWRVAFALQAAGWYLRSDIIWAKPNPMPESVTDRPTKAHEYLFLFSKNQRYYYDAESIKEPISESYAADNRPDGVLRQRLYDNSKYIKSGSMERMNGEPCDFETRATTRNKRTVWFMPTGNFADAHFATFPPDLIKPCIMAGCPIGGTVLDPFAGSGTTGMVAIELGRKAVLIELNPDYVKLAKDRCNVTPGLPLSC